MAPIQNKSNSSSSSSSSSSSYSVHKSSSNQDSASSPRRNLRDFSSRDDDWESFLPVTRRGRFFQDSFFENTRSHFDDAVRDALRRWGEDTVSGSDFLTDGWHDATTTSPRLSRNLSRYREMRSRQMDDDDNMAVTVTSDNNVHKIVLDVHDFVEGDLKVRVVGDRDLLVEGRKERGQDGASAVSNRMFSRRFALPEQTNISAIDSVMSSDGILTITAPKVGRLGGSSSQTETSSFSSSTSKKLQDEREPCDCDKCNPKLHTRENCHHSNVERSHSSSTSDNLKSKLLDEDFRESSEQRDSKSDSGRRVNSYSQEKTKHSSSAESSAQRLSDKMDIPIRAFFNSRPITRRGRFFDDAFFEDSRSDYRTAIQDILSKWDARSSNMDDITNYRNLRTRDLREDNQAVRTIEDEFQHKFVVDVQDFVKGGEINVKAVDDRELVVEGNVEHQEGGSKSIKRFSRRFLLPDDVHLESVTSVMSSDGVLTIIAPKKNAISHTKEIPTSANTQKIENNSEVYEKVSESHSHSSSSRGNQEYDKESNNLSSSSSYGNQAYDEASTKEAKCSNLEFEDRNIRGSSTCSSSGVDASLVQETESSRTVASSVSKAEEASQEASSGGGQNISIHVEEAEDIAMEDAGRDIRERSHEDMDVDFREAKQKIVEELRSEQRSSRGRSTEERDLDRSHKDIDMDFREAKQKIIDELRSDQRSVRGSSAEDLDIGANMRSVRERSMESRGMRGGSTRFDSEMDEMEDEDDDINFQGSSRHSEKKLRSILKTPDRYLKEEDERHSRERSYAGEESLDGGRRTPSRDAWKKPAPCGPLNPNAKRVLPINVRGHFCSDAFFDDFQENFKIAISDVLLKFNEKSSQTDDITAYRNLRLRDPKLENQAFHVQEDQKAHKVVLDVKDFITGDIEAAVYDEKELVVEGRAERRTGTSITTLSFLRRFPLPEDVDADAITVVMSSDGVLTVVTPWKGSSGLSAIKNILSTEDKSIFDRQPSDFDRRWDEADWEDSRNSDEFLTRSLDSRLRSRLRHATDDLF